MIRKLARPMIASVYIADGVDTLVNTDSHVKGTEAVIERLRSTLPRDYAEKIPRDPELVARGVGATKVGAGSLMALGKFPRLSAGVLAATAVPTILARHAFWDTDDEQEKDKRRNGFLTNIALLGGLVIATVDTEGKPGLTWRTKHAAKVTNKKVQAALPGKSEQEKMREEYTERAHEFAETARERFGEYSEKAGGLFEDAQEKASEYIEAAQEYFDDNKDDWLERAKGNAETARKKAVVLAAAAQDRADEAAAAYSKKAPKYQKKANKARRKAYKKLAKKFDL